MLSLTKQVSLIAGLLYGSYVQAMSIAQPPMYGGRLMYPVPLTGTEIQAANPGERDACGILFSQQSQYYKITDVNAVPQYYTSQYINVTFGAFGQFGFGPLKVKFSSEASPNSLNITAAVAQQNMPGDQGYLAQAPDGKTLPYGYSLLSRVPSDLKCPNGGYCLMSVSTPYGYVGCTFVRITPLGSSQTIPAFPLNNGYVDLSSYLTPVLPPTPIDPFPVDPNAISGYEYYRRLTPAQRMTLLRRRFNGLIGIFNTVGADTTYLRSNDAMLRSVLRQLMDF